MKGTVKSISGSIAFKALSTGATFITVPLLLKAMGTNDYAVWVTVTALMLWIGLFDFGSGYSLKNKVTEMVAAKDESALGAHIITTIQFYLIATSFLLIAFLVALFELSVFREHKLVAMAIYIPLIAGFPFTVGHFILQGLKKFNVFNFFLLLQTFIWLGIILLFSERIFKADLVILAFLYGLSAFVINFSMFWLSVAKLDFNLRDVFNFDHFRRSGESLLTGLRFFLLQVSGLVVYSIGNILIYSNLSKLNVAQYDTVNKIYMFGMLFFNIVISVYWSEISHAKVLKDIPRLRLIYKYLLIFSLVFSIGMLVSVFIIPFAVRIWTKGILVVQVRSLYPFAILFFIQSIAYSGAVFLNAFEKLNGQIVLSVIAALMIIPLARYFFSTGVGISAIPLASLIVTLPTLLYANYQAQKCIKSLQ